MSTRFEPGPEGLLLAILHDTALLQGAACVGLADLFDPAHNTELPDETADRHNRATAICRTCKALPACSEWAVTNPARGAVLAAVAPPRKCLDRTDSAA